MAREGHTEKVTVEQDLKWVRESAMSISGRRVIWVEEIVSAKALRWKVSRELREQQGDWSIVSEKESSRKKDQKDD